MKRRQSLRSILIHTPKKLKREEINRSEYKTSKNTNYNVNSALIRENDENFSEKENILEVNIKQGNTFELESLIEISNQSNNLIDTNCKETEEFNQNKFFISKEKQENIIGENTKFDMRANNKLEINENRIEKNNNFEINTNGNGKNIAMMISDREVFKEKKGETEVKIINRNYDLSTKTFELNEIIYESNSLNSIIDFNKEETNSFSHLSSLSSNYDLNHKICKEKKFKKNLSVKIKESKEMYENEKANRKGISSEKNEEFCEFQNINNSNFENEKKLPLKNIEENKILNYKNDIECPDIINNENNYNLINPIENENYIECPEIINNENNYNLINPIENENYIEFSGISKDKDNYNLINSIENENYIECSGISKDKDNHGLINTKQSHKKNENFKPRPPKNNSIEIEKLNEPENNILEEILLSLKNIYNLFGFESKKKVKSIKEIKLMITELFFCLKEKFTEEYKETFKFEKEMIKEFLTNLFKTDKILETIESKKKYKKNKDLLISNLNQILETKNYLSLFDWIKDILNYKNSIHLKYISKLEKEFNKKINNYGSVNNKLKLEINEKDQQVCKLQSEYDLIKEKLKTLEYLKNIFYTKDLETYIDKGTDILKSIKEEFTNEFKQLNTRNTILAKENEKMKLKIQNLQEIIENLVQKLSKKKNAQFIIEDLKKDMEIRKI
ncbi:hypothetical protein CWI37_0101p0050 [Hamiltosporidium tvaerminnensis]|uniref:Uncharacterized protein n=1 Tax=Hamiltosporidium tvaerminnensis TaxID=1176355 RepID=A0A4Q9LAA0_9MICR|nr:hypothetical protein LUQ84_001100 [Hamiltosporidium tvaerminnensis]TBU04683.1 hypothetical protein CWI37_0101p0050 [Hamiltosporidium tvaerminnensis]